MSQQRPAPSASADRSLIEALAAAVAKYGCDWCGEPRRCEAMLKDLLAGRPREVQILVAAVESGVVRELIGSQSTLPVAVRIERCVRRLHDEMSLREDVARRAVDIWAVALGVTNGMSLPPRRRSWIGPALAALAVAVAVAAVVFAVVWWKHGRPTAPRATSLDVARPGPFKAGDDLDLVVSFSGPVHVTGSPRIGFTVNGESSQREALFVQGNGSDRLTFRFEVPYDAIDATGIALDSPPAIDPAGGAIVDPATGAPAALGLDAPASLAAVRIDAVPPRIRLLRTPQGGDTYWLDAVLVFAVEFGEPVEVSGKPELVFRLGAGTRRAHLTGRGGPTTLEFSYRVAAGDAATDGVMVTGIVTAAGSIRDVAGNPYDGVFEKVPSPEFAVIGRPRVADGPTDRPQPGQVVANSIGMKLVLIPDGEFDMGSNDGNDDEKNVHRVRISKAFLMGQTEVTQGQFREVMGTAPWHGQALAEDGRDVAASYVSWNDAVTFCERLSGIEGRRYRLPTEAEWEYACRARTTTRWSFGDDGERIADFAWVDMIGDERPHEVASKAANPWKLFDMHGNVSEWVADWYADAYPDAPTVDPTGPVAGESRSRRGGSFGVHVGDSRAAARGFGDPVHRAAVDGFRVVREVE